MKKLSLSVAVALIACVPLMAEVKMSNFSLSDQKDVMHKIVFPSVSNRVFFVADKESGPQAKVWGENVMKVLGSSVEYNVIVAPGDVPGWQQGIAKGNMKNDKPKLLDWGNKVSVKWGFKPKTCLILYVDRLGNVVSRAEGDYTKEKFDVWMGTLQRPVK